MKNDNSIKTISVITSSVCNLNCSFCYLHKNKAYKQFHELTMKAWEDQSYLINIKKSMDALNVSLNDVNEVHFWGGETLLEINTIAKNIPLFYKIFPNLKEWHMSTNWVINTDAFFNFVKEIDNFTSKPTKIIVQISIDAPPGELSEDGHNGWPYYKKNFINFITRMNNTKMHHIEVIFHFKSTLSKENYFKQFSTYEKMSEYMHYMVDFMTELDEMCISRSVSIREKFTLPTIALPHDFTREEGEQLFNILKLWETVSYKEFLNQDIPFLYGLTEFDYDEVYFNSNRECGELKNRFTMLYDGTITECSGTYIDHFKPYQDELLEEGNLQRYYQSIRNSRNSFNPINATQKEIEKWKWKVQQGYRNNFFTYTMFSNGILKELVESRQIDAIYSDPDIRLNRLLSFCNSNACTKENSNSTKIPYLMSVGHAREYFNGVMEYGHNYREAIIKQERYMGQDNHANEQGDIYYDYNV